MAKERWKDIPGYKGLYRVSDQGRIKSLIRPYCPEEKILKNRLSGSGYDCIHLCKHSIRKQYYIHTLVLSVFVGPCPEGLECRHINLNKRNNFLNNLIWGRHGTKHTDDIRGVKRPQKLTAKKVIEIRKLYKTEEWTMKKLAIKFGISFQTIFNVIHKKNWRHI
jgi:hypothetical protein